MTPAAISPKAPIHPEKLERMISTSEVPTPSVAVRRPPVRINQRDMGNRRIKDFGFHNGGGLRDAQKCVVDRRPTNQVAPTVLEREADARCLGGRLSMEGGVFGGKVVVRHESVEDRRRGGTLEVSHRPRPLFHGHPVERLDQVGMVSSYPRKVRLPRVEQTACQNGACPGGPSTMGFAAKSVPHPGRRPY